MWSEALVIFVARRGTGPALVACPLVDGASMSSSASWVALTRSVSPSIARCELSHVARAPIDFERACAQHEAYERHLEEMGCRLLRLPAAPDLPDAVFVEDTALVLNEVAILARPGASSRRAELPTVREALSRWRPLREISAPATLDGGDVLVAGKRVFVGRSRRTNPVAIEQVRTFVAPFGYDVQAVPVNGCLHLKSAVAALTERSVLVNPAWTDPRAFEEFDVLLVDPGEPFAANAVRIGDTLLVGEGFPRTLERLRDAGLDVRVVDLSELAKAEGAVTCCSLILRGD
jgi:dimethylargininase